LGILKRVIRGKDPKKSVCIGINQSLGKLAVPFSQITIKYIEDVYNICLKG